MVRPGHSVHNTPSQEEGHCIKGGREMERRGEDGREEKTEVCVCVCVFVCVHVHDCMYMCGHLMLCSP